jgi:hypothetical protein
MAVPGQTVTKYLKSDRSFDKERLGDYSLALQAGVNAIRFAVLDEKGTHIIALGELENSHAVSTAGLNEQVRSFGTFLDAVCETVPWIVEPFGRIRLAWEGPNSTLVPAALAVQEEMWEYLAFGHKLEAGETVLTDRLTVPDAFNVFSVPEKIRELLTTRFSCPHLCHHTTAFLAGVLADIHHRQSKPALYAYLSGGAVNLAMADRDGLKIHNRFPFSAPEDVIYYMIYVLQQFSVEPGHARIVLTGQITPADPLWALLGKYVGDPVILPGIADIFPGKDLEEAPIHEWFPLLNLSRCGS